MKRRPLKAARRPGNQPAATSRQSVACSSLTESKSRALAWVKPVNCPKYKWNLFINCNPEERAEVVEIFEDRSRKLISAAMDYAFQRCSNSHFRNAAIKNKAAFEFIEDPELRKMFLGFDWQGLLGAGKDFERLALACREIIDRERLGKSGVNGLLKFTCN